MFAGKRQAEEKAAWLEDRLHRLKHKQRMNYSYHAVRRQPIGSGVTEAACKVLIKQRFCKSGSRWKEQGASAVLSIRALKLTAGRWNAFWKRISQYGYTSQSA